MDLFMYKKRPVKRWQKKEAQKEYVALMNLIWDIEQSFLEHVFDESDFGWDYDGAYSFHLSWFNDVVSQIKKDFRMTWMHINEGYFESKYKPVDFVGSSMKSTGVWGKIMKMLNR